MHLVFQKDEVETNAFRDVTVTIPDFVTIDVRLPTIHDAGIDAQRTTVTIRGKLEGASAGVLRGWAWDTAAPELRLNLQILIDGSVVGHVVADRLRKDLEHAGIGSGAHGFEYLLSAQFRDGDTHRISLRLADDAKDTTISAIVATLESGAHTIDGRVEGLKGRQINGWAWDRLNPQKRLEILVESDGATIGKVTADLYRSDLRQAGIGSGHYGFKFFLDDATRSAPPGANLIFRATTDEDYADHEIGALTLPADWTEVAQSTAIEPPPVQMVTPRVTPKIADNELIALAIEAERAKNYIEAAAHLDAVLLRKPKSFDALFRRARIARASNDLATSREFALRAMEVRPADPWPAALLARVADKEGQRTLALEYWNRVPKSHPTFLEGQQARARLLLGMERPDEARLCLESVIAQDPSLVPPRRILAQLLHDIGEHTASKTQCEQVLQLVPADSKTLALLATLADRRVVPAVAIARRYRNPLSARVPVVLAAGNRLADCVLGGRLITALAEHFDCKIEVVVPHLTPAADFVLRDHPSVAVLHAIGDFREHAEVGFVLPEYVMAGEDLSVPDCRLLYNYTDLRSVKSANLEIRYRGYAAWLSEICNVSADACLAPFDWDADAARSEAVLVATSHSAWTEVSDLTGEPFRMLDLGMPGMAAAAEAIDDARAVVCADEDTAIFAISRGAPVIHLSRHGHDVTSWLRGRSLSVPAMTGPELRIAVLQALAEFAPRAAALERPKAISFPAEGADFIDQLVAADLTLSQDTQPGETTKPCRAAPRSEAGLGMLVGLVA
jgi:Tfp pilus assembly protein PilF